MGVLKQKLEINDRIDPLRGNVVKAYVRYSLETARYLYPDYEGNQEALRLRKKVFAMILAFSYERWLPYLQLVAAD